jgi:hypothetical protein
MHIFKPCVDFMNHDGDGKWFSIASFLYAFENSFVFYTKITY